MRRALLLSSLVPALVFAQTAPPAPPTAPTAASSAPAAAPGAAATAKKDDKANPLANAVQARTPEEQAKQSGWVVMVGLETDLGAGTFVDPKTQSYLGSILSFNPMFQTRLFGKGIRVSAAAQLAYEYTLPDAATGRRVGFSDISLGATMPAAFREPLTGIAVTPSLGLTIPASPESFQAGLITSLRVGASFSRRAGPIDLRLNVNGTRGFYTRAFSAVANPAYTKAAERDAQGHLLRVCRDGEPYCAAGGMNPAWGLSLGGSAQWRATGDLMLYVGYTYMFNWREAAATERDEFTAPVLDSNGNNAAQVGYGRSDRMSTFIGASYQVNNNYSLDIGVQSTQAALTVNPAGGGWLPLFPIFNQYAWPGTQFYLALTAAY